MRNPIDLDLLDRYLAGECTPEEAARVRAEAESDSELRELLTALPQAARPAREPQWNQERAWSTLVAAQRAVPRRALPWRRMAAAAVILLAIGLRWPWPEDQQVEPNLASRTYMAPMGSPERITLADGSTVTLAPGSTLNLPSTFPHGGRDVQLNGEGFFEVTHDAARPYVVHTAQSETRVLGTSFNVSAYADATAVEVVVVTGRVQLSATADQRKQVLTPGQLGKLDAAGEISVQSVDVDDYTSWTRGLSFDSVRFVDALPRLERWFGVNIEIADRALGEKRVTAFFAQQPLPNVLDALATTLNARYERTANGIVFHTTE